MILTLRKDSASTYSAPRVDFVRWNASDYPNQYDYIGDWRFGGGPGGLGVQVVAQAETDWGAGNAEAQLVVYASANGQSLPNNGFFMKSALAGLTDATGKFQIGNAEWRLSRQAASGNSPVRALFTGTTGHSYPIGAMTLVGGTATYTLNTTGGASHVPACYMSWATSTTFQAGEANFYHCPVAENSKVYAMSCTVRTPLTTGTWAVELRRYNGDATTTLLTCNITSATNGHCEAFDAAGVSVGAKGTGGSPYSPVLFTKWTPTSVSSAGWPMCVIQYMPETF